MAKKDVILNIFEERGLIPNSFVAERLKVIGYTVNKKTLAEIEMIRRRYVDHLHQQLAALNDVVEYFRNRSQFAALPMIIVQAERIRSILKEDVEKWIPEARGQSEAERRLIGKVKSPSVTKQGSEQLGQVRLRR